MLTPRPIYPCPDIPRFQLAVIEPRTQLQVEVAATGSNAIMWSLVGGMALGAVGMYLVMRE